MKGEWKERAAGWRETGRKLAPTLLILAVGIALLLLPESGAEQRAEPERTDSEVFALAPFEEKVETILSSIAGAGETQVALMLDTGSRTILAQDQERDREGGLRSEVVTVGRGSGTQEVVSLQTVSPVFRGAVVVCPGGDDPEIRLQIIQAVSALTGLGSDRIAVSRGNLS